MRKNSKTTGNKPAAPDSGAESRQRTWSMVAAVLAWVVYILQMPGVSGDKDGSEITLVLATCGVAHPTGYPVFTIIGHYYCALLHNFGASWDLAANSFSVLGGSLAVYFFCRFALSLLTGKTTRTLTISETGMVVASVVLFVFNPAWGYDVKLAEVYSWHVCWAMCTMWMALRIASSWSDIVARAHWRKTALLSGFLAGLGMTHHLTAAFIILPLAGMAAFLQLRKPRVDAVGMLLLIAGAILPIFSYGYIFFKAFHPSGMMWPALGRDISSIMEHITGSAYRHFLGTWDPSHFHRELLQNYVWPFLIPSWLLGCVAAAKSRGEDRIALLIPVISVFVVLVYNLNYGIPDPVSYFHVPLVIVLAVVPASLNRIWMGGGSSIAFHFSAWLMLSVGVLCSLSWIRTASDMKKSMEDFEGLVHDMWSKIPMDTAFVVWSDDAVNRLRQYQILSKEKTGLIVVNPAQLPNPLVRNQFLQRYGFDAVGGADTIANAVQRSEVIARNINSRSAWPVIIFDPAQRSMRLLEK